MQPNPMRLVLVALNGELRPDRHLRALLERADCVIAADGGANWLAAQGRVPDLLVGDMDSVDPALLESLQARGCRVERHPTAKDETDAELALAAAADLRPDEIVILGALGGRIDHALANLALLALPQLAGIPTHIWDGVSKVWLVSDSAEIHGAPGDTVSLIPWGGDACGITTQGLAYPLRDETLRMGPSRGVSNLLTAARAQVQVERGQLLIVHTPAATREDGDDG